MDLVTAEIQGGTEYPRDNGLFEALCRDIKSQARELTNVSCTDGYIQITDPAGKVTQIHKLADGTLAMMSNLF